MSALKPVIQSWRARYYGLARVGPSTILRTQYARTNVPVGRLEHVRTGTPRAGARERGVWSRTADGAEPRASVTDGDVPIPAGSEEDRGPRPVVHLTRASGSTAQRAGRRPGLQRIIIINDWANERRGATAHERTGTGTTTAMAGRMRHARDPGNLLPRRGARRK
jgi:hypothetical protein